jgi:hypothetical protein
VKDILAQWLEVQCPQWKGSDLKVFDTTRVKGVVVALEQYRREERWAYSQKRVSNLIVTLIPCKQRYTLKLSAIALNESTSDF